MADYWLGVVRSIVHVAVGGFAGRFFRAASSIAAACAVLLLLAMSPVVAQDLEYRLDSGDQLRITIFGQADLSGQFEVGSNGRISMPLIGEVRAAQRTLQELERAIIAKLKPDYLKNPQLSVEVANYRPFYIIGEVKKPGSYAFVVACVWSTRLPWRAGLPIGLERASS